MVKKPIYEELEGKINYLEKKNLKHKRINGVFQKNEASLRSLLHALPVGIGVVFDRVVMEVNERLCDILGYSPEEILGKSARMFYPTDEDFEHVGIKKYKQIHEKGIGTIETRMQRKDGSIIDVFLSSSPIDPKDLSMGVTFTVLDITLRKQSERKLQESETKVSPSCGIHT